MLRRSRRHGMALVLSIVSSYALSTHTTRISAQEGASDAGLPPESSAAPTTHPPPSAAIPAADSGMPDIPPTQTETQAPELTPPDASEASTPTADHSSSKEDSEAQLGTVVVTAQRRADTLERTPIAVTAFDKDAVKQQNISNFRDLAGRTPGLLAPLRSTAYTTQTYSIRGIGETDTYPEPSVAVYIDDVYLARSVGSMYDTPDLERVEVLRGPQGTLYGRNSSAGAIRFITRDPTSKPEAGLSLRLGELEDIDIRGRVSGPVLPNDLLNASASVVRHKRRGYTWDVPLEKWVNDIDIWAVRLKTKSNFGERFSVIFSADMMLDRSTQSYYTPVNQPNGLVTGKKTDPDRTWSTVQPLNDTDVYGGSLTLQYDIDDHLTLKSVTAIRGMDGPIYYDNDGVTWIKGDSYAGFNQNYETQEVTLNGEYERLNFVAGLYYFNEYFHNHRLSQAAGSPENNVGTISHTDNRLYTQSISGFGEFTYKFTDALSATLGARYTLDVRRFENFGQQESSAPLVYPLPDDFNPALFTTLFTENATTFDAKTPWKKFDAFTPKVGVQYQVTPDALAYASISQGFKSGGFDLRATTFDASVRGYRPQKTTAYEIGWKSSVLGNRLLTNISLYYNQIHDLQVRATSPGSLGVPVNLLINAGDAHSYGAEAEIAAQPIRGLRLGTSIAYLRTDYDTFTATLPPNVAGRDTLLGLRFPLAPTWQANFNFSYRLPLKFPGAWRIGADVPFESKRYTDIYNTSQTAIKAQAFVNGTINYTSDDESWSAGVQVSNLFDLRRRQAGNYAPTNAGTEPLYYGAYNPPRIITFFLRLGKI